MQMGHILSGKQLFSPRSLNLIYLSLTAENFVCRKEGEALNQRSVIHTVKHGVEM